MIKKLISIFLTMCMVLTMVPVTVAWAAETTGTFGNFTVTYSGTAPTFSSNILTFAAAGESYTVGMASGKTSTSNCIMVSAENVTLNFNGVNIVATSGNALIVTGSNTTLHIIADSSLTGTSDIDWHKSGSPGINGNVSISGEKRFTVTGGTGSNGGNGGTGIGGTITADTGLVVMAGSSPTPMDILTGNTTAAQYVTIALPLAAVYATASPAAASDTDYVLDTGSKTLIIKTAKGAAWWSASGTTYLNYAVKLANVIDVSAFQVDIGRFLENPLHRNI